MGVNKPVGTYLLQGLDLGSPTWLVKNIRHMDIPTIITWIIGSTVHQNSIIRRIAHLSFSLALGGLTIGVPMGSMLRAWVKPSLPYHIYKP